MTYGVKVIHTYSVGKKDQRFYEELILKVEAFSFDEAYEKAEIYMRDYASDHLNPANEPVKTYSVEAIDCFLAFDPEGDVQEVYSSFSVNNTSLSEDEYYKIITSVCSKEELRPLLHKEFNA